MVYVEPRILNPESGTHRLLTKNSTPFPLEILHFSSFKEIDEKEWNELTEDDFPFSTMPTCWPWKKEDALGKEPDGNRRTSG